MHSQRQHAFETVAPGQMNRYCTLVAALTLRTTNGQGRKLSTARAIELLEDYGVQTPDGVVRAPKGLLKRPTVNRWLQAWGYDHRRMLRAPAAVRFEARRSNECWLFDMNSSDLKRLHRPEWVEPGRGEPTLMLFSVVDDRSGAAYPTKPCRRTGMTETFYTTQQVRVLPARPRLAISRNRVMECSRRLTPRIIGALQSRR